MGVKHYPVFSIRYTGMMLCCILVYPIVLTLLRVHGIYFSREVSKINEPG